MNGFSASPKAHDGWRNDNWTPWFTLAVLLLVAGLRIHSLKFPLERDEGEYAYMGQLMLRGAPPYQLAYTQKLPGTHAAYAVIMAVFGQSPTGIHFGLLLLTTTTALMLFWLGSKMVDSTMGMAAATAYAVMAASPWMLGLAGHATHFCAFFATAGLCLMWRSRGGNHVLTIFAAGLMFGVSLLMKQHAVIIIAWAAAAWMVSSFFGRTTPAGPTADGGHLSTALSPSEGERENAAAPDLARESLSFWQRTIRVVWFGTGIALPYLLCCLLLWQAGVFEKFWFWTVRYAREYESINSAGRGWHKLVSMFPERSANSLWLWLMAAGGCVLVWFDSRLRAARWWLISFGIASFLAVVPGFFFRQNYFLITLPGVALLAGAAVSVALGFLQRHSGAFGGARGRWTVAIVYALVLAARLWDGREVWFARSPTEAARAIYALEPFPEAEVVSQFIQDHSQPTELLAVLGDEPEIYFRARRLSATAYIGTYPLAEAQRYAPKMQEEMMHDIEARQPEWLVFYRGLLSWKVQPGVETRLLDWWDAYQTNYALLGIADVVSATNTVYLFSTNATTTFPKRHSMALELYRRRLKGSASP